MTTAETPRLRIRSREIADADFEEVAKLLGVGLDYPAKYFSRVLEYLGSRPAFGQYPKYGYVLEVNGQIAGAILLIFTVIRTGDSAKTRCHVTSWYVRPHYRCYATLFFARALNHPDVTYLNVSARKSTVPIIKVQGFSEYSYGQFVCAPAFQKTPKKLQAKIVLGDTYPDAKFEVFERDILLSHAKGGCITFWCVSAGRAFPFVFQARLFKGFIPGVQLIYCSDLQDFVHFARTIGSFLALRGKVLVRVDANGKIPGLWGRYFKGMEPRFYKGPMPRLGDLAYTQAALCGYERRGNARSNHLTT